MSISNSIQKILSYFIAAMLIFSCMPVVAQPVSANTTEFAGGNGTADDPYLIETKEHLNSVRNHPEAHYKLISDINFSSSDFKKTGLFYNNGEGWLPIGSSSTSFSGVFNGNGHTISGVSININTTSAFAIGLFGYSSGTIVDLIVLQSSYSANTTGTGRSYAGGIVAYQSGGHISGCIAEIEILVTSSGNYGYPYVGGIVAYADNNTIIENCHNRGNISLTCEGSSYTGGIAGELHTNTYISACANEGTIRGGKYTGGIAGETYYATISNCKNNGMVNGSYCAGGIVGYASYYSDILYSFNAGNIVASYTVTANSTLAYAYAGGIGGEASRGTISNCYNTGEIKAEVARTTGANAGGIVGRSSDDVSNCYNVGIVKSDNEALGICASTDSMNGGSFSNCYYLNTCSDGVAGSVRDTTVSFSAEQVLVTETYAGFDFVNVWEMGTNDSHPFPQLISNKHNISTSSDEESCFAGGNGTILNPYEIATKEQLNRVRDYSADGKWFVLVADIQFDKSDFAEGGAFYNNGQGWLPIGSDKDDPFTGGFDGNNHKITGLQLNITGNGDLYVGLFGYCEGAIFDLYLADVSIRGTITGSENSVWAGGICGYLASGTVEGCTVSGSVAAYETCVESQDKSKAYAGGLAGRANNGTFTSCINLAQVTALADSRATSSGGGSWATFSCAGGIVSTTTGTISKSYNTGKISAEAMGKYAHATAGGIVAGSNNDISMCYNTGMVRAVGNPNNGAAGIAASYSDGTLSNCYNTGYITSDGNVAGIVEYLSSGTVSSVYNVGEISGYSSWYVRAIIADAYSGTVKNCYYTNTKISGIGRMTDTSIRLSFDEAQKQSSYAGYDFNSVWKMCELSDHPYPELQELNHTTISQPENTTEFLGGTGTYFNPFKIATKEHLNNVRNYPSAYFIMVDDIEFTNNDFDEEGIYYNDGAGWEPIGTSALAFAGTFDGNGHVIKDLYVNIVVERGDVYAGLFGTSWGTIKNLGLANSQISASVVGTNSNYICMAYAGGIVGDNFGVIEGCYNTGRVYAFCETSQVGAGGIAGKGDNIKNCFNTGYVKAHSNGKSYSGYAGGITSSGSSIECCYNTGLIEAIAGHPTAAGITAYGSGIVSCYYLDNVEKGVASTTDPSVRCSLDEMSNADTFNGFDFNNVWTTHGNADYPYPELINSNIQPVIVKIDIDTTPSKTEYLENIDDLNVSDGYILVSYDLGITKRIPITQEMVSGFDNTLVGRQTLTVTYGVLSCNYDVIVTASDYVSSWNVAITDRLRVNFHIRIRQEIENVAKIKLVSTSQSILYHVSALQKNRDGHYIVSLDLSAAQMNDDIVIQVINGDDEGAIFTYTVHQYCNTILADNAHSQYHTLVKKMLNYGAMAQLYFDYDVDNLANNGISDVANAEVPETADEMIISDKITDLSFYGASLVYRDRIAVRYYFTSDVTDCTFTANGSTYTPVAKDGMYYVEIPDILPQNLDQQITLVVTDAEGIEISVSYSPMNYIVRMNAKSSENLKNLLKALYNYHLAAKELSQSAA